MLREVGMAGTGIKDVVARSGAPIGSLYHYFPGGKTQLVSESVQINADKSRRLLSKFFDGKQTGAAALRALFHTAADGFERAGGKGCAVGAVTLDLRPDDAALREICKSTLDDWVAIVAPRVPFADERARRGFAMTAVAALEGAFVLAKAARSGEPFRDIGDSLAAMISGTTRRRR
jgi:AcrR family transcriptional regulator